MGGDEKWLTPKEALEAIRPTLGNLACHSIIEHLRAGILHATASRVSDVTGLGSPEIKDGPLQVAASYWNRLQEEASFWAGGVARFDFNNSRTGTRTIRCFGIKLLASDIEAQFTVTPPAQPVPLAAAPVAKHAGGAPPKDIWERAWVEIAARLYDGRLQPKKQRDIEDALVEVVMSLGDQIGEATARRHAKPLWDKIKPGS
jgi:hypothetical protein